jgi:N-acetylneuraminic acid mutarotase
LPNELFRHGSFASGGRIYVVGGEDGLALRKDVLVAIPSATGGVGTWAATESLPIGRTAGVVVTNGDHVYVVSGSQAEDGGLVSTGAAIAAGFTPDGGLTGWQGVTGLPFVTNHAAGVATGTQVFVSGGYGAPSGFQAVMVAPIDFDGTLGPWAAVSAMNIGRAGHAMVFARGHLYVIGGQEKSGLDATSVEVADLDGNGTLSAFRQTAPLPSGRAFIEAAVVETSP